MAISVIVLEGIGREEVSLRVETGGEVLIEVEDASANVKVKDLFSAVDLLTNAYYAEHPNELPDVPQNPEFINGG